MVVRHDEEINLYDDVLASVLSEADGDERAYDDDTQ